MLVRPSTGGQLLIEGLKEPMIILLLSIAALSFVFGKISEAVVMVFIVGIYIIIEFVNKFRTDRIMARLKKLSQSTGKDIRPGIKQLHNIIAPFGVGYRQNHRTIRKIDPCGYLHSALPHL